MPQWLSYFNFFFFVSGPKTKKNSFETFSFHSYSCAREIAVVQYRHGQIKPTQKLEIRIAPIKIQPVEPLAISKPPRAPQSHGAHDTTAYAGLTDTPSMQRPTQQSEPTQDTDRQTHLLPERPDSIWILSRVCLLLTPPATLRSAQSAGFR